MIQLTLVSLFESELRTGYYYQYVIVCGPKIKLMVLQITVFSIQLEVGGYFPFHNDHASSKFLNQMVTYPKTALDRKGKESKLQ